MTDDFAQLIADRVERSHGLAKGMLGDRAAAARGTARLHERLAEALALATSRGEPMARSAVERSSRFGRFGFGDLKSIADSVTNSPPERTLVAAPIMGLGLPAVPARSVDAYRREEHTA